MSITATEERIELETIVAVPHPILNNTQFENRTISSTTASDGRIAANTEMLRRRRQVITTTFIICANLVQMISNISSISGGLAISKALGINTGPGKANWVAASYPLTQGTFVLVSGRLGEVYSHRRILLIGLAWLTVCSLLNGFCNNFIVFSVIRALSGIGGALIMPNAVAMIGITCPPGRMRNLSLGFFGASAPMAGSLGSILAGVVVQFASWKWIFFIMVAMCLPVLGALSYLLPLESPVDPSGSIDWVGAALGTIGLILFNVAWNQAPAAGWSDPSEAGILSAAVVLLVTFILWEWKFAKCAIIPVKIWSAPSFLPLMCVVLFSFMSFGTLLWYMIAWQQEIRHWSVLNFAIGWIPFGICGTFGACLAGWLIPRLAAQWILAIGLGTVLVSNLLLATMPDQQTYWAQIFPATLLMSFCPDLVYTASQIIASNSVRRSQQGTAASLVGLLNLYGNSLGLGFAGTVETEVNKTTIDVTTGYRAALYFGAALAGVALLFDVSSVRMARDVREGWENPEDMAI